MKEFKLAFANYANFSGRSTRREFWMYILFYIIFYILSFFIGGILSSVTGMSDFILAPLIIYLLAVFIPTLAISVRRLHDANKSGWYLLLSAIPLVGLYIIYLYCVETHPNTNKWGPARSSAAANSF